MGQVLERRVAYSEKVDDPCPECDEIGAVGTRHIPLVVENVKGAQRWVGRAKWHYGSYYLWGDVPALMPSAKVLKVPGFNFHQHEKTGKPGGSFQSAAVNGIKAAQDELGGYGGSFGWNNTPMRRGNSRSAGRKAASAMIAKIPFELARWIAVCYKP